VPSYLAIPNPTVQADVARAQENHSATVHAAHGVLANDIDHTDIHSSATSVPLAYLPGVNHHGASGGGQPCARAYATIRRASAAETILSLQTMLIRPALKPQSSE
jgi:hypothetical protein